MNQLPLWRDPLPIEQWAYRELATLSDATLIDVQLVEVCPSNQYLAVFEAHYHSDKGDVIRKGFNWELLESDASGYVNIIYRRSGDFTLRWAYASREVILSSGDDGYLEVWAMLGYPDYAAELVIVPAPDEFPLPYPTGYQGYLKTVMNNWYSEQNAQYFADRYGGGYRVKQIEWDSFGAFTVEQTYVYGLIGDFRGIPSWRFEYAKWWIECLWQADAKLMDDLNELAEEYAHLSQQRAEHCDDTLWKQLGKRSSMVIHKDTKECVRKFWERRQ